MTKTLTFAILHFSVAFSVAYLLTGSIAISSTVALVEPIVNTVAFFFHEKAWQKFDRKRFQKKQETEQKAAASKTYCCGGHSHCMFAKNEDETNSEQAHNQRQVFSITPV